MPDQKTSNTVNGAASGASTGASVGGGWGALIGGVLGAAAGSQQPTNDPMPKPINAPAPVMPGAVQGSWGGVYRDPVTGAVYFSDTSGYGANNPYTFQNQALINSLMGGSNGSGDLYGQQLQNQIDYLTKQAQDVNSRLGQNIDPTKFVNPIWLDSKGTGLIDISNPNSISRDSDLYKTFMSATGGNYGSKNRDISFSKWLHDAYDKSGALQWDQYKQALKEQSGNKSVIQSQLGSLNNQIANLKTAQTQYGSTGSAAMRDNPLLDNVNRMDEYSKSAGLMGTVLDNQTNAQADEFMRNQADQDARRGLSGSGISEMVGARLGLQKSAQLNQNKLATQQYGAGATQQALASRLGLLGYLQGQQTQGLQNQLAANNASLGQLGMGYGMSSNAANATNNWNMANAGIQGAYNMNQWNMGNISNMNANANMNGTAGALGYLAGSLWGRQEQTNVVEGTKDKYKPNDSPWNSWGSSYGGNMQPYGGGSWEPQSMRYGTSGTKG